MDIEKTIEFILQAQAHAEERHAQHDREMGEIRAELRRAVKLAVIEGRNQRRRSQELDKKITQLSAAQMVTEEKLQRLISTLERGRNGSQN